LWGAVTKSKPILSCPRDFRSIPSDQKPGGLQRSHPSFVKRQTPNAER
jgi:hypothetical protein